MLVGSSTIGAAGAVVCPEEACGRMLWPQASQQHCCSCYQQQWLILQYLFVLFL